MKQNRIYFERIFTLSPSVTDTDCEIATPKIHFTLGYITMSYRMHIQLN